MDDINSMFFKNTRIDEKTGKLVNSTFGTKLDKDLMTKENLSLKR